MKNDPKPAAKELALDQPGSELAHRSDAAPATQSINVAQVLQAAVQGGVSAENVAVVKELVALQERMEAREAEKAFARAFNGLQSEMPAVQAMKPVRNNDGSLRYKFAPYEDIMEQVRPQLLKHGFTVTFSLGFGDGRVTQKCTLTHVDGHSRTNEYSVRIGKGPPGSSESQADGAAGTYAKRHALCDALNIVIEKDNDGVPGDVRDIGSPISQDKIVYLKELVKETKVDEARFLAFARVQKYEEIGDVDYPRLVAALEKKRQP